MTVKDNSVVVKPVYNSQMKNRTETGLIASTTIKSDPFPY